MVYEKIDYSVSNRAIFHFRWGKNGVVGRSEETNDPRQEKQTNRPALGACSSRLGIEEQAGGVSPISQATYP